VCQYSMAKPGDLAGDLKYLGVRVSVAISLSLRHRNTHSVGYIRSTTVVTCHVDVTDI
jgi:hypothetical protein